MKISYITPYDASDIHNWSGLGYYIAKSFENQCVDIDYIGSLHIQTENILKLKRWGYKQFVGKDFDILRKPRVIKKFTKQIIDRLKPDTDIIFSPGSGPIAFLETNKPKIFYTDATFAGMVGFYNSFSNLSSETIKHGNQLEQQALDTCSLAIYSSEWAAKTAIDLYNADRAKIKIVPFGANIECNRTYQDIDNIIQSRSVNECNLLFMGVDWERKGGNIALNIAKELNDAGLKTTLFIVGLNEVPIDFLPDFAINLGFISKSNAEGVQQINELFTKSHFLLVPSVAEAYGLVFCEANSFGLPAISHKVGGITTIIRDDVNGKTFLSGTEVSIWSNYIMEVFTNKNRYRDMCLSSFNEYQYRLNWDVAGKTIINLLKELV